MSTQTSIGFNLGGTAVLDHAKVHINQERCAGCQECVIRCPVHALSIDPEKWVAEANDELCVGCRQCERVCPYSAIAVTGPIVVAARVEAHPLHAEPLTGNRQEIRPGFQGWSDGRRCSCTSSGSRRRRH